MSVTKLRITRIRPMNTTHEEVLRLYAARDLNIGKPTAFGTMLDRIWSGEWTLWRIDGAIKGICVTNPEGQRLNIYYLHGDGLFGKMRALTDRLLDIARKGGYEGISCCTRDKVRARLFRMVPGARCEARGNWYILELDDHGRKSSRRTGSGSGRGSKQAGNGRAGRDRSDNGETPAAGADGLHAPKAGDGATNQPGEADA